MGVTVVTNTNFGKILPSVLHHIKEAEFIAFDTELTGLTTSSANKYFYYDEINSRYRKLKDSASNFGMLQIGLSAFKYKPSGNQFSSTSWSFHLFPTTNGNNTNDYRRWTIQLSSFAFLKEHKFDFNKTFLEGISYLSKKDEVDLRQKQRQLSKNDKDVIVKSEDKVFLNETFDIVREWIREGKPNNTLTLPPCNSFQRLLLYKFLPKEFGENISLTKMTSENGEVGINVKFSTEEERARALKEEVETFENTISEQIGFRKIFDLIVELRKPLVGHNCWLDLCHIWSKFVGPLTNDWDSFKNDFRNLGIGPICDTKFMANQLMRREILKVSETSLESLSLAVDDKDRWGIKVKVDGGKTKNSEKFHDAGYDSYCTGKVFVGMATLLAQGSNQSVDAMVNKLFTDKYLYLNRLNMMQSDYEDGILLIETEENLQSHPNRDKLLVLTNLPPSATTSHIYDLLSEIGLSKDQARIFWLDSKTVYIYCEDFEVKELTLNLKVNEAEVAPIKCLPYSSWNALGSDTPSSKRPKIDFV